MIEVFWRRWRVKIKYEREPDMQENMQTVKQVSKLLY